MDGHELQIDELNGTKPTEKIDLSDKGLGIASAIIIASCIKGNGVLKELKCAVASRVFCQRPLTRTANTLGVPTSLTSPAQPLSVPLIQLLCALVSQCCWRQ